jgi:hypothetical protein
MADVLDPRHWRERAERTRDKAEQFNMRNSRDRLLKIAEEYDRLAERAAERWEPSTQSVPVSGAYSPEPGHN